MAPDDDGALAGLEWEDAQDATEEAMEALVAKFLEDHPEVEP